MTAAGTDTSSYRERLGAALLAKRATAASETALTEDQILDAIMPVLAAARQDPICHISGWSYPPLETYERLTKAIGTSIDGFEFEISSANCGTPGRVHLEGSYDEKKWAVDIALVRITEGDNFDFEDEDDE